MGELEQIVAARDLRPIFTGRLFVRGVVSTSTRGNDWQATIPATDETPPGTRYTLILSGPEHQAWWQSIGPALQRGQPLYIAGKRPTVHNGEICIVVSSITLLPRAATASKEATV